MASMEMASGTTSMKPEEDDTATTSYLKRVSARQQQETRRKIRSKPQRKVFRGEYLIESLDELHCHLLIGRR